MSAGTLQPCFAEQHALNRRVWERLVNDPTMSESINAIESDRDGHLIMSPPPRPFHRIRQDRINQLLKRLLPQGDSLTEGAVSTPQGVKLPDVVWCRAERSTALEAEGDDVLLNVVPDLCVEVLSPGNTDEEIGEKVAACFAAGVREVWICQRNGKMSVRELDRPLDHSVICPEFPDNVPAKFLRPWAARPRFSSSPDHVWHAVAFHPALRYPITPMALR